MTSERTELYGRTEFLANCGGLLGLFLGVSVMSVLEIVYFCSIRVFFNRRIDDTSIDLEENVQKTSGVFQILRDLIADYSTKTTIQGINYVGNTELSRTERFWWTIFFVISSFCCGSLIFDTARHYQQSPVIVTLATDETPISEVRKHIILILDKFMLLSDSVSCYYRLPSSFGF
jgi:Amiloride-sensitive sodium channel